jgi:hypothetical protein
MLEDKENSGLHWLSDRENQIISQLNYQYRAGDAKKDITLVSDACALLPLRSKDVKLQASVFQVMLRVYTRCAQSYANELGSIDRVYTLSSTENINLDQIPRLLNSEYLPIASGKQSSNGRLVRIMLALNRHSEGDIQEILTEEGGVSKTVEKYKHLIEGRKWTESPIGKLPSAVTVEFPVSMKNKWSKLTSHGEDIILTLGALPPGSRAKYQVQQVSIRQIQDKR